VLRPVGIGDTAAVACRDGYGCWGWIEAYRESSDRPFGEDELALLADIGPALGSARRRSVGDPRGNTLVDDQPPGVLVLDQELRLHSHTDAAGRWIDLLPAAGLFASWGMLPAPIYPVATMARSGMAARAHALVPSDDGRWTMIEAATLAGRGDGQIAVTLRALTPTERFELCRVHALSARERQLIARLAGGLDTKTVTQRLYISPYTVQDHLKSVFAKLHVHSRRELLAKLNGRSTVELLRHSSTGHCS
jgi:DNA-binding CsgD family transcriptional regulator